MKFLEYYNILEEARRYNMPSVLEQLSKYKDDPDIYVTFTALNKVGINPRTGYSTPIGIYCYPLKKTFVKYFEKESVPWASDKAHLQVFRPKNPDKIARGSTYTREKLNADLDALEIELHTKINRTFDFIDEEYRQTPIQTFWSVTRKAVGNNKVKWGALLARFYHGFVDDLGQGFIHPNEPIQAVFFNSSFIKVVDMIRNNVEDYVGTDWNSSHKKLRMEIDNLWRKHGKSFEEFLRAKDAGELVGGRADYRFFDESGLLSDIMPLRKSKELHYTTVSDIIRLALERHHSFGNRKQKDDRKLFNNMVTALINAYAGEQI